MNLDDMNRVLDEVDNQDKIRKYELTILEHTGWKFNNVSPMETSRILMRKFFEIEGKEFNLDSVEGYLQGFLLVCSHDKDFL